MRDQLGSLATCAFCVASYNSGDLFDARGIRYLSEASKYVLKIRAFDCYSLELFGALSAI